MGRDNIQESYPCVGKDTTIKTKQTDGLFATYTYIAVAYKIRADKYIIKTVEVLD